MVIELIRYTLQPGDEPAFEEACRQAAVILEAASQCLGFVLTRATRDRNRYILTIYWDSPDGHLIGFRQSNSFREYEDLLRPYANAVEESGHYRKTGVELTKKALVRISGPPR